MSSSPVFSQHGARLDPATKTGNEPTPAGPDVKGLELGSDSPPKHSGESDFPVADVWRARGSKGCVECGEPAWWVFGKRGIYGFRICWRHMSPEERLLVLLYVEARLP